MTKDIVLFNDPFETVRALFSISAGKIHNIQTISRLRNYEYFISRRRRRRQEPTHERRIHSHTR